MRYGAALIAVLCIFGCAGEPTQLHMKDTDGASREILFPEGTVFGGASKAQTGELAQMFVDSHNMAVQDRAELLRIANRAATDQEAMKATLIRIEEMSGQSLDAARRSLRMLEEVSRSQGSGEITIFYPVGSSRVGAFEQQRLVNFADYLARESRGRKIMFVSIGSASAFGKKKANERIAKKRSEAPSEILEKYLVNVPHEFHKVYGVGDMYSPAKVPMKQHQRYQNTRIIAFFDMDQLPTLP